MGCAGSKGIAAASDDPPLRTSPQEQNGGGGGSGMDGPVRRASMDKKRAAAVFDDDEDDNIADAEFRLPVHPKTDNEMRHIADTCASNPYRQRLEEQREQLFLAMERVEAREGQQIIKQKKGDKYYVIDRASTRYSSIRAATRRSTGMRAPGPLASWRCCIACRASTVRCAKGGRCGRSTGRRFAAR